MDEDMRQYTFDLPNEESDLAKVLVNNSNYVGKKLSTDSRVPGRIGKPEYFDYWRDTLKASDYILSVLQEGYKFPFDAIPPESYCRNNKSFLQNRDFGYAELLRLEALGCITRVSSKPYLVLPLSVVFSKKLRLVVDASRHLNPYIKDLKIKLEDLDVGEQMIKPGDYQTTADLDSGYWHVPLSNEHKQYVGVHFITDSGEVIYWVWNVLFLGVKSAVHIFTKILIPHKQYLRSLGIRVQIFIDDQRILSCSFELCKEHTAIALEAFSNAGWTINVKKSSGDPKQSLTFLGLDNDTLNMKYFIPQEKKENVCDLIVKVLNSNKIHIKVLAKLCGKLQFLSKAIGPCVRLLSRSSYYIISNAKSWNSMVNVSDAAKNELNFLLENIDVLNGFPMRPSLSQTKIDFKISSDASDLGFAVYEVCDDNDILLKRVFNDDEKYRSSTERELIAFHDFYLNEKASNYRNSNLIHYTDNMNCETILTIGSRNPRLQPLVLDIFLAWKRLNMKVTVIYISRSNPIIELADQESRNFDLHDFSLDFENFLVIANIFGEFIVDCFANAENKKCVNYYSKFTDIKALSTNFFAQRLPNCNLYVFPPVHLIIPALYHLQKYQSFGCFIAPMWISSHFWPFICEDGRHFNRFIKYVYVFSPCFVSGNHVLSSTFKGVKQFSTLAFSFDFKVTNAFKSRVTTEFCVHNGCDMCRN